jgi:glutamate/tyrosine decarboxylase-like PLP-dependent enzyme
VDDLSTLFTTAADEAARYRASLDDRPVGTGRSLDARTDRVIEAVQRDGTCWMGGTTWHGRRYMRISVSNYSTTQADVDRSVAAITRLERGLSGN